MRKPAAYLFAMLVGAIVWFFFQHFRVEGTRIVPKTAQELNGEATDGTLAGTFDRALDGISTEGTAGTPSPESAKRGLPTGWPSLWGRGKKTTPPTNGTPTNITTGNPLEQTVNVTQSSRPVAPKRSPETIRIASFHLHHFGARNADPAAIEMVANVVRYFDIVAIQGISPGGTSAVGQLARQAGNEFDTVLGNAAEVRHQDEQFAYIFNRNTIVADRGDGLYTLGDPDGLLKREPLVGWFRAKLAAPEDAFTFTLVNVNTQANRAQQELGVLDNAMHEIRNDGREEDDVIMLGSFQAPDTQLGELGRVAGLIATIRNVPTNIGGDRHTENIVFKTPPTDEFTNQTGVFQFIRAFNIESATARLATDHMPVWAEFSIYEGGQRGRVAQRAQAAR